jgi:hypothetical protein
MSSCNKGSNNKYFKCPPRMSDGRHFTDYRPSCHVNNMIRANNKKLNSFEYRNFLTKNANELMDLNRKYACQQNGCGPCKEPYNQGTMLPEQSIKKCNNNSCNTDFVNDNGLGQGRQYSNNTLCSEWPETLPINQMSNCCADTNNLFNYYNQVDTKAQGEILPRKTVPSGGDSMRGGDPIAFNL